jgi:hypothetical protein
MTVPTLILHLTTTGFLCAAPTASFADRGGSMVAASSWVPNIASCRELSARMLLAEIEGGPQSAGAVQTLLGVQLEVRGTTAGPPPG